MMESKNCEITTRVVNNLRLMDRYDNNEILLPVVYTKPDSSWPFTGDDLVAIVRI